MLHRPFPKCIPFQLMLTAQPLDVLVGIVGLDVQIAVLDADGTVAFEYRERGCGWGGGGGRWRWRRGVERGDAQAQADTATVAVCIVPDFAGRVVRGVHSFARGLDYFSQVSKKDGRCFAPSNEHQVPMRAR